MKITQIDLYKINLPIKHTTTVPIGSINSVKNVFVKISTNEDIYGWGEASPFGPITGGTQATNFEAGKYISRLLLGKNPINIEKNMKLIKMAIIHESSIRSAFDMALYDILGKKANLPLYKLWGGEKRVLYTDETIGLQNTVDETLARVTILKEKGFDKIKLKTGRPGLQDLPHVQAVRDLVGTKIKLKIDSNQGWDYPTAVNNLRSMKPLDIEYSEQPLAVWDYRNLKRLRDTVEIPICADESVFDEKDAFKLTSMQAVDYLNIKLGKSGGLYTAFNINAIAEASGCKCMIGCFMESRLGLTAAAHLAIARPNITFLDLDSGYQFTQNNDPIIDGMQYDPEIGGKITLNEKAGLGLDVKTEILENSFHYSIKL